jgi:hypothetical protein
MYAFALKKAPIKKKLNEISPHIRILTRKLRRFDLIKYGFKHAANLGLAAKRADVHLLVYYLTTTVKKALPSATLFLILDIKAQRLIIIAPYCKLLKSHIFLAMPARYTLLIFISSKVHLSSWQISLVNMMIDCSYFFLFKKRIIR